MFAEERQEKLLGILREKRKVAVSEMCDVFNVSGATIRADLRQLEEEGLLTRTHGGAVLRTRASFEQASDDREIVNLSAKERIGQRAAALVEDGDIIVLDTGTTTLHIARNIRDRQNVTVVTNDYQIARELEASPSIQTILLGGIVKKGYHCVVAINGRSILDTLNVDKAFMGTNSLSLKHGACVADIMLAETKRGMVEHASSQALHDQPEKDLRGARAAVLSIVPYSSGAAKALGKVIPELDGRLTGYSLRVPVPVVSIVDLTVTLERDVTVEEVNNAFREAAAAGPLKGILGYSDEPLVSSDYQGDPRSSIIDGLSTLVIGGNMVKILAWYDNEWGFSNRLVDLALMMAKRES